MSSRRSKLELVFDILQAVQNRGGVIKPTHLMYKSNLSHKLLNNYLDELVLKGMIEIVENEGKRRKVTKMVALTEKGSVFLAEFRRIKDFTEAFGL